MKVIFLFLFFLMSTISYAENTCNNDSCGLASPSNSPTFCATFKKVAICHCTSSGLPPGMCQDMKTIFSRMIGIYGSQDNACLAAQRQGITDYQTCMDDWNCYRYGGHDSKGGLCSSTGSVCS